MAHAPMAEDSTEHGTDQRHPRPYDQQSNTRYSSGSYSSGGGSGGNNANSSSLVASMSSQSKFEHRSTPPRHKSRRRRKRSSGHIPSNSGKVQVDFAGVAGRGMAASTSRSAGRGVGGPCGAGHTGATCGGILILPSPLGRSNKQRQTNFGTPGVTSPTAMPHPMSPVNSLDLDKMSLCGTEIISHGGGSLGGASLCNVFEEHDSVMGASVLMDMSMSLGSHPSSGGSVVTTPVTGHRVGGGGGAYNPHGVFGEQESMMGTSALMDLSVGSGTSNSKAPSNGSAWNSSGSGNHSGSGGSSSRNSRGSGRSTSPASMDKSSGGASSGKVVGFVGEHLGGGPSPSPIPASGDRESGGPLHGQDFMWAWDGKSKE